MVDKKQQVCDRLISGPNYRMHKYIESQRAGLRNPSRSSYSLSRAPLAQTSSVATCHLENCHGREARTPAEKAQQTVRDATDAASETVGKASDTTPERRARMRHAATKNSRRLAGTTLESMARANQAMLKGASDLSRLWASYWNEQMSTGMQAVHSLAECHGWDEAVAVQNEFARTSLDRVCSQSLRSAEVTAEMLTSSLAPLQEPRGERRSAPPADGIRFRRGGAPS